MTPRPRHLLAGLTALVGLLVTTDAHSLGAAACTKLHEHAQALALEGKLGAARLEFAKCMDGTCPSLIRVACASRYEDAASRIPSVILAARSAEGADLVDVAVDVDGKRVSSSLTGTAIELDPGPHRVRMVSASGIVDEFDMVVREGEKLRTVVRELRAAPVAPPAEPAPKRAVPWTVYGLGALGVVGVGAFAFFGVRGANDYGELKDRCAPRCSADEERGVRNQLLAADISLGIAVLATAAALWVYLDSRKAVGTPAATAVPLRFAF